ncbi:hypothetical protein BGX34_005387 [Mortierella sp. NVP85]|nr:hypothetical protein BGX34_005387 [Mortierella sp. NVP85]
MASASTSAEPSPHSSLFDVPELVGIIAQYLSSHDIAQCMVTSKAWAHLFEPFLWREVVLGAFRPTPRTLERNRHRIRCLHVHRNFHTVLPTLAADLPSIESFSGSDDLGPPTPEPSCVFPNLRSISLYSEALLTSTEQRRACFDYIVRILNQSPGLTAISLPEGFLEQPRNDQEHPYNHIQCFLYTLANRLPCVQELDVQLAKVQPDHGLEFLRVCFNHPQLVDLHCNFQIENRDHPSIKDTQQLEAFLKSLEDDKKAREASGRPAVGTRIKELLLPQFSYPLNFLCTLLKSHLPNLERFDIPDIQDDGTSYRDSLREAIAHGCPKLQHILCSNFNEDEEKIHEIFNGIIDGCRGGQGIKSLYCEQFADVTDDNDSRLIMETLLDGHAETLEDVELGDCQSVRRSDLVNLFSKCKNLKRVRIESGGWERAVMKFQDVVSRAWVCHDLRELQLTFGRPTIDQQEEDMDLDETSKSDLAIADDGESRNRLGRQRFETWVRRIAKDAYGQIGRLSRLEELCIGYDECEEPEGNYEYDLTLEHGWLGELAGLKELKHFHMAVDFWTRMGQPEVEFMDAQWPKLDTITFQNSLLKILVMEPHWQWLQEKRPYLQYEMKD